jgi:hypothetical protein
MHLEDDVRDAERPVNTFGITSKPISSTVLGAVSMTRNFTPTENMTPVDLKVNTPSLHEGFPRFRTDS